MRDVRWEIGSEVKLAVYWAVCSAVPSGGYSAFDMAFDLELHSAVEGPVGDAVRDLLEGASDA